MTLGAFVAWEGRTAEPLMPFSIFRLRTVVGANVVGLIMGTANVRGVPDAFALHAAKCRLLGDEDRCWLPRMIAWRMVISSALAAQLVNRVGVSDARRGDGVLSAGLLYFTQVSVGGSYVGDLLPDFLLISVGLGFSFVPISIAAAMSVPSLRGGARPRGSRPRERSAALWGSPCCRRSRQRRRTACSI